MVSQTQYLEEALYLERCLNTAKLGAFWQPFYDEAEIFDKNFARRMSKVDFMDHMNLQARGEGLWESFGRTWRELKFKFYDDTGHVSKFSAFRGKTRHAGFRQRFMGFPHTCIRIDGDWKLQCLHQSPLLGRIVGASPT